MLGGELKCTDQEGLHGFGGFLRSLRVIADSRAARDLNLHAWQRQTGLIDDDAARRLGERNGGEAQNEHCECKRPVKYHLADATPRL